MWRLECQKCSGWCQKLKKNAGTKLELIRADKFNSFWRKGQFHFKGEKLGSRISNPRPSFRTKWVCQMKTNFFCTNDKSDKFDKERMVSFLVFLGLIYLFLDRLVSLTFRPWYLYTQAALMLCVIMKTAHTEYGPIVNAKPKARGVIWEP